MKRREFIRLGGFITASVAAMGMTGCDIVGENDNTSTSVDNSGDYPNPVRPMPAAATGANWQFPQSVASGDPKPDSILLWTRVVDSALSATAEANADVAVTLRVTQEDNSGLLGSNTALAVLGAYDAEVLVPAYIDFDGTVRHKLSGLAAGTVYYYQFVAGDVRSKVGRFKTAPAASSTSPVTFAFMSCQDWSSHHWGAFAHIVAGDTAPATPSLDFVVHLGDYIYETDNVNVAGTEGLHGALTFPVGADIPPERTTGAALPADPPGKYAVEKADYRYLYKTYRSDARIQAMHERFPMIAVWDDHEFSDDAWQNSETYTNANLGQYERRRNANQVWFEYMPADVSFQETNPSFQNISIYRDLKFGQVVHLVMTDERLYKQDHLIPESTPNPGAPSGSGVQLGRINSRYLAPEGSMKLAEGVKNASSPNMTLITMLGATQREWWKSTMVNSTAAWKVWGNEVSLLRMGLNGPKAIGTLVALQTVSGIGATMTAQLSNTQVQGIPAVAAGAGAAIGQGAATATAIPASFAIAQTFAATGNAGAAIAAGEAAGLTNAQATAALNAIGTKSGSTSAAEVAICATTVTALTPAIMTTNTLQAAASLLAAGNTVAMLLTDAAFSGAAPASALAAAATGTTTINSAAATIVANVYLAAKAAAGSGQSAQVAAAASAFAASNVMFALIRAEVEAFKTTSAFVLASPSPASLQAFMRKFILNADQWDGYGKERASLMNHIVDNDIQNVVAITGDIHAFFAGTVYNEFKGEIQTVDASGNELTAAAANGSAAMVDLVTAGISSTSWYTYITAAATALSASLATLASATVSSASTGLPFNIFLPVLDFSMGKPYSLAALTQMVKDSLKQAAAAATVPESSLDGFGGVDGISASIASNPQLQGLCSALGLMGTEVNPWLAHVDTNAQGYAVVTASTSSLSCEFRRLNNVFVASGVGYQPGAVPGDTVSGGAPRPLVARTVTATVAAGATPSNGSTPAITIS